MKDRGRTTEGKVGVSRMLSILLYTSPPVGEGMLSSEDGAFYEGEFHNNRRHGEGCQIDR